MAQGTPCGGEGRLVRVPAGAVTLEGDLAIPGV